MPVYIWKNRETGEIREDIRAIADMDKFLDTVDDSDNWHRVLEAPAVLKRLIPSGFGIRERDYSWQAAKEVAALEDSTLDLPTNDPKRKDIKKEINKIQTKTRDK